MPPVMMQEVKEKYGREIVFWGGGAIPREFFAFGNPVR